MKKGELSLVEMEAKDRDCFATNQIYVGYDEREKSAYVGVSKYDVQSASFRRADLIRFFEKAIKELKKAGTKKRG